MTDSRNIGMSDKESLKWILEPAGFQVVPSPEVAQWMDRVRESVRVVLEGRTRLGVPSGEHEMSNKEKVLAVYPDARESFAGDYSYDGIEIVANEDREDKDVEVVGGGWGFSHENAWANAAERLAHRGSTE